MYAKKEENIYYEFRKKMSAKKIKALKNRPIDFSDIPEVTEDEAKDFYFKNCPKYYKPVKERVTIRIDSDVLQAFRSAGEGYQTRMNAVLRAYVEIEASQKK